MILIALGANMPHPEHGPPRRTLEAALAAIEAAGVTVVRCSPWFESPPWPPSDQPWYANGVAVLESDLEPAPLLALLHGIERDFGRVRGERNEARVLDLDLLDYDGRIRDGEEPPQLPHPRLAERGFVLLPLQAVAPGWRHPLSGLSVEALIERLPEAERTLRPLA